MGKKGGNGNGNKAFMLKVDMHCHCLGCVDRIPSAVRDLINRVPGLEVLDQSTLETTGEVRLLATGTVDPERLRRRLHKVTGKHVDLVLLLPPPKPVQATAPTKKEPAPRPDDYHRHFVVGDQPAPPQYYAAWPPNHHHHQQVPGVGWNNGNLYGGAAAAYPWEAAYPAAAWAPYAYPPPPPPPAAQGGGGHGGAHYGAAYYGGAPAWQG